MARHGLHSRRRTTPPRDPVHAVPEREHLVRAGDTLSSIAREYGIATAALLAMNGLSWSSGITTGQRLSVPGSAVTSQPSPHLDVVRHTIAAGETVSMIAERYGVRREAVLSANGLHPTSLIFIGQVLLIPEVSVDTQASPVQRTELAG